MCVCEGERAEIHPLGLFCRREFLGIFFGTIERSVTFYFLANYSR